MACNYPAIRLYSSNTWNCVLATGDTDTLLCLDTCPGDTSIMASGGTDREARVWMISIRTEVNNVHEKDINCFSWWSDSHDKLAKLWSTDLDLMTVLWCRSMGVWCVKFSPDDSGSAVATIKLWAINLVRVGAAVMCEDIGGP